ncbi:Ig-like domain-containing protein, partial [Shinella sp. M31]|uniref:Ig-like domain-containing protein n=1 Tax=Shinella sp. M31 TaxID=3368615 RepID=UPI003BA1D3C9
DTALAAGETSLVTFTFSEAVTGFTNADLTIANGMLSSVSSSDGGITWTATLTPTAGITDTTNLITLDNTGVADLAGNAGTGITNSNNYSVDSQRPTATIVVADTALAAGETSLVTFTFSEAVTGFTLGDLAVANGLLSGLSTSDNITWTATLTPSAGITDTTNLITLDNTGVADLAGNAGTGTTNSNNYSVDSQRPTAIIVVADNALAAGETSLVTFTFSEAVTGFTNADLSIANGTLSSVSSSDGGVTWTATLTPTAGVTDTTNLITLNNSGLTDLAGNAGTGTNNSNNYSIDTQRPTATVVVADTVLAAGETSAVTFTFSEAVTGFTNADLSIANGMLSSVSSSDGGITWTATLTPTAGITDTTNLITLDNTGVADLAGNAGTGITNSNNYTIDSAPPRVASITRAGSEMTNASSVQYTVTFTEGVSGVDAADFSLTSTGGLAGTVANVTQVDSKTYTVTVSGITGNGSLRLDLENTNTSISDAAGNAITSGYTTGQVYYVDRVSPIVTSVGVPANRTYVTGQDLEFTVNLTEAVIVNTAGGTPKFAVTLDTGGTVYASYVSGSGTSALIFRLPVKAAQMDMTGITLGDGIDLNGGAIRDAAGNNLALTLNGVSPTTGVLIGNDAPKLTGDLKATVSEGGIYTLTAADLGFSDADDG